MTADDEPSDISPRRAAAGDDVALAALIQAYQTRVHRFAMRACRDEFDADDAVQEAFIKLARRPDVVAHPRALSWLFTVVRHACFRLMRPFAREQARLGVRVSDSEKVADVADTPHEALERFRLVETVHLAIGQLALEYREVLVLRDIEGLSGEEVCAALGLTEAGMKTRLHRARQQVRQALVNRGHLASGQVQ